MTICGYFAESEREYISIRTKQELAAARAKVVKLGRPKGSRNKERVLDPFRDQNLDYLQMSLNLAAIRKIINNKLEKPISCNSYKYLVQHAEGIDRTWATRQRGPFNTLSSNDTKGE